MLIVNCNKNSNLKKLFNKIENNKLTELKDLSTLIFDFFTD